MKGLILAAGLGTRLRPLTRPPEDGGRSKPLVPLANQPLIAYPLGKLLDAGIDEIGIVVGSNADEMRAGLRQIPARLSFIPQPQPRGLAHAVQCAREFCGNSEFVLLFCDNLFAAPLSEGLAIWEKLKFGPSGAAALIHTYPMPDPRACGVAVVEDGWVVELEEKPAQPKSNLAVIGIDILTPLIFDAIERIKPSARGELEITDAIAELITLGRRVHAQTIEGFWFDTGTFADLITAQRPVMLASGVFELYGAQHGCSCDGPVGLGVDSHATDTYFAGPVLVGAGARIDRCRLGPAVSVGAGCELLDCELGECQVYPGTQLSGIKAEGMIFDGPYRFDRSGLLS
jgi:glucose-1-phosphate thymidylyltransferase